MKKKQPIEIAFTLIYHLLFISIPSVVKHSLSIRNANCLIDSNNLMLGEV